MQMSCTQTECTWTQHLGQDNVTLRGSQNNALRQKDAFEVGVIENRLLHGRLMWKLWRRSNESRPSGLPKYRTCHAFHKSSRKLSKYQGADSDFLPRHQIPQLAQRCWNLQEVIPGSSYCSAESAWVLRIFLECVTASSSLWMAMDIWHCIWCGIIYESCTVVMSSHAPSLFCQIFRKIRSNSGRVWKRWKQDKWPKQTEKGQGETWSGKGESILWLRHLRHAWLATSTEIFPCLARP